MKKEIVWINIVKGIAIFLMVCGHTSIPIYISNWIWSFHMPLFFIISGYLYNPNKYPSFKNFAKRKIQTLAIPYILFTIIVLIAFYNHEYFEIEAIYKGWGGYALWFIPVLLFTEFLFYIVQKYKFLSFIILYLYLLGFILYKLDFHLPFKIEIVCQAIFYYYVGHKSTKVISHLPSNLFCAISLIGITFLLSQYFPRLDMCENIYGSPFNAFLAIIGTLSIISIAKYIYNRHVLFAYDFFIWAGKNTLIILGLSQVINIRMKDYLTTIITNNIINSVIRHILLWSILYILSIIINKYMPLLVGKSKII